MKKVNYAKELLEDKVKDCYSFAELCRRLGLKPEGSNPKTVRKKMDEFGIDYSHFTGQRWNTNPNNPVYDLKLIQNEFNIYISIKNYGLFSRVEEFFEKSEIIKEIIKQNIQNGCNTIFIINEKSFPSLLDWRSLQKNLPTLLNLDSKITVDDDWW